MREAAHRRAVAEFETAFGRLSEEDLTIELDEQGGVEYASRSWKFAKQLEDSVFSLVVELNKAISDKAASLARYQQKHDKLWEDYNRDCFIRDSYL